MVSGITILFLVLTSMVLCDRATPVVRGIALRLGIVDRPGGRKGHRGVTPLLGGVSIAGAALLVGAAFFLFHPPAGGFRPLLVAGAGALLMHGIGTWDDACVMRARQKLLLQTIVATGVALLGLRLTSIDAPSVRLSLGAASLPFTVLWIVTVTNAWNLIDGIDGLAAGTGAIAAAAMALLLSAAGMSPPVVLMLALAGACAGFLRHNFSPASIFMGDGGSLFIGYILAVAPLVASDARSGGAPLDVRVPLLVYVIPLADMAAAVIRRGRISLRVWREWGIPIKNALLLIGVPDRRHLHHLLLRRMVAPRKTTLGLFALAALGGGSALVAGVTNLAWPLLAGVPLASGLLLGWLGCFGSTSVAPHRRGASGSIGLAPVEGRVPAASQSGRRAA
jgi:UDP-GlcNAc:undecaprenyl-phosphate/decaprenyl-phosphate GlcNAc-1-phosphate transferase